MTVLKLKARASLRNRLLIKVIVKHDNGSICRLDQRFIKPCVLTLEIIPETPNDIIGDLLRNQNVNPKRI